MGGGMKRNRGYYLFFAALFFPLADAVFAEPDPEVSGQYIGILRHDHLGTGISPRDQLAKLDLIVFKEGGTTQRFGVLTLHFGDFKSREYVSFHFDNIRYLFGQNIYTFEQANQGVSIHDVRISGDKLEGRLGSKVLGGVVGKLSLTKEGTANPQLPLIEPVWGEYKGVCQGSLTAKTPENKKVLTTIQLVTYRSSDETVKPGNPFAAYEIRGQIGEFDPLFTEPGDKSFKTAGVVTGTSYHYFKDELSLNLRFHGPLVCRTDPDGIECNSCRLKRISAETTGPRALKPPRPKSIFFPEIDVPELSLSKITSENRGEEPRSLDPGDYFGYVHHEFLDQYQMASLHIEKAQEGDKPRVFASANLSFGDLASVNKDYAFDSVPEQFAYPFYVFRNPEADVDALLWLTPLGMGGVRGVWYSQLFGRVGTFELHKGSVPELPRGSKLFGEVDGEFEGKHPGFENHSYQLALSAKRKLSTVNTQNPFFPLVFEGYLTNTFGTLPNLPISDGSYDFYTGRIAIETSASESANIARGLLVGERESVNKLKLKQSFFFTLGIMQPHVLTDYKRVGR